MYHLVLACRQAVGAALGGWAGAVGPPPGPGLLSHPPALVALLPRYGPRASGELSSFSLTIRLAAIPRSCSGAYTHTCLSAPMLRPIS